VPKGSSTLAAFTQPYAERKEKEMASQSPYSMENLESVSKEQLASMPEYAPFLVAHQLCRKWV